MKSFLKIFPIILASLLFTVSCNKNQVNRITLEFSKKNMVVGETFVLNVSVSASGSISEFPVSYRSDNRSVATVDPSGLVTAVSPGNATIMVNAGSKTAYCDVVVEKSILQFKSGVQNFWGDLYRIKLNAYDVYLLDNGLRIADNGDILGTGVYLYLDLNTHKNDLVLQSGVYEPNLDGDKPFTYVAGFVEKNNEGEEQIKGSYLTVIEDSKTKDFILIKSGDLTFRKNNDLYTLTGDLITEDNEKYAVEFRGELPLTDFVTPMPQNLTQGSIQYWGDADKLKNAHLFNIRLGDDYVDMNTFEGGLDKMSIEIGVPTNSSKIEIPIGEYPIQNQNIAVPNYATGGFKDEDGNNFGSWYYTGDEFKLKRGTVKILKNGTIYTLEYNFEDDYFGYNIKGKFVGELAYSNMVQEPANNLRRIMRTKNEKKSRLTRTTRKTINTQVRVRNER